MFIVKYGYSGCIPYPNTSQLMGVSICAQGLPQRLRLQSRPPSRRLLGENGKGKWGNTVGTCWMEPAKSGWNQEIMGWLVVWNIFHVFHILGMSYSQLTFIFFRGVGKPPTRNCVSYICIDGMHTHTLPHCMRGGKWWISHSSWKFNLSAEYDLFLGFPVIRLLLTTQIPRVWKPHQPVVHGKLNSCWTSQ